MGRRGEALWKGAQHKGVSMLLPQHHSLGRHQARQALMYGRGSRTTASTATTSQAKDCPTGARRLNREGLHGHFLRRAFCVERGLRNGLWQSLATPRAEVKSMFRAEPRERLPFMAWGNHQACGGPAVRDHRRSHGLRRHHGPTRRHGLQWPHDPWRPHADTMACAEPMRCDRHIAGAMRRPNRLPRPHGAMLSPALSL